MKVIAKLTVRSLFLVLILHSCADDRAELPPPDVSSLRSPVELIRFDEVMMDIDTADVASGMKRLDGEFGDFSDVYFRHITPLRRGDLSPEEQALAMKAFLTYPLIQEIHQRVAERFSPEVMNGQKEKLEQALRYYKYYLPDAPRPDTLVAFIAQFELAAFLYGDGQMAVGLDFFLGPEFDYQSVDPREPIFSDYLARAYTPDHMTSKLMQVLIDDYVPRPRAGRLVDFIIYEGKKAYLLNKVLPETPDHLLHEVTEEQMNWLRDNEIAIYASLQKENQFFDESPDLVRKLTQPAPSSPGMPAESPGRAVNYLGEKIVEAFIRANPQTSMEELLAIEDGQEILAKARYKPR
ncbi:gliding motility protein GldB-related protein [Neolewinella agarilytica]|uniref:Protein involved in gliding motility GldB n=1 Tax=Neolewinella agarilytica TaxID=478744 RepID=A0A1H9DQR3_9BACT|nr:hypothetical protein [Neolewinella agarilytica]SEQ15647.1 protein involved in gliding motility GldB [Neolewinella agarilytica]